MTPPRALALLVGVALAGSACATAGGSSADVVGANPNPVDGEIASDPQKVYDRGVAELKDGNYLEAQRFLEHVTNKFPFSQYAVLAELALADNDFDHEKFAEAADSYAKFAKLHPTHAKADYAAYRAALCHYRQMPADIVIFPPAYEKDQAQARAALVALDGFIAEFPSSSYAKDAHDKAQDVRTRLAHHEDYVGNFYFKRGQCRASLGRYEGLLRDYAGLGFDEDALFRVGTCAAQLGDKERARTALQQLEKLFPATHHKAEADALLSGALKS